MCGSRKREAAGRRQGYGIETANDERRRPRSDALLHRPEGFGRRGRLDQQHARGIETEACESGAIKSTELARAPCRPAPHYETR